MKIFGSRQTDPRKVETPTSLTAGGSVPTPKNALSEVGSQRETKIAEVVPALASRQQAVRVYDRMTNNDATVDVALRAAKVPVMGAEFFMEAFDEKEINQDINEFVSFNLLEGTNEPWLLTVENILRMYEDGSSVFEPVWELGTWTPRRTGANAKRYTMLRKLGYRPASTIKEFKYDDNGGPAGVTHLAIRADGKQQEEKIDIEKLVIFTLNKRGGNLEGKSLLRTAYKHWYYKDNLYKIDAIQKERHALGVPIIKMLGGYSAEDVAMAWEMVTNMRTNEKAGAVLPPGFEFEFAQLGGAPVNVMPSIDHHDSHILLNVMTQFLVMGIMAEGGGGRATGGTQLDMFQKSLKYVANMMCEVMNLYIVPKIVGYNFKTTEFPKMRVRNVGESKDLQMFASAWSNLAAQNLITMDYETEQHIRKIIDFPLKKGGVQTPEANAGGQKGDVAAGDDPNKVGGQKSAQPGFEGSK